ncbi:MAG: orotate phosphoribosyltransferase [Candidatus Azotimanducaceae bacterium]|jgi:orotate phosphoribosyltransferase
MADIKVGQWRHRSRHFYNGINLSKDVTRTAIEKFDSFIYSERPDYIICINPKASVVAAHLRNLDRKISDRFLEATVSAKGEVNIKPAAVVVSGNVLVVDDVVVTGRTMNKVLKQLELSSPGIDSIQMAALLVHEKFDDVLDRLTFNFALFTGKPPVLSLERLSAAYSQTPKVSLQRETVDATKHLESRISRFDSEVISRCPIHVIAEGDRAIAAINQAASNPSHQRVIPDQVQRRLTSLASTIAKEVRNSNTPEVFKQRFSRYHQWISADAIQFILSADDEMVMIRNSDVYTLQALESGLSAGLSRLIGLHDIALAYLIEPNTLSELRLPNVEIEDIPEVDDQFLKVEIAIENYGGGFVDSSVLATIIELRDELSRTKNSLTDTSVESGTQKKRLQRIVIIGAGIVATLGSLDTVFTYLGSSGFKAQLETVVIWLLRIFGY